MKRLYIVSEEVLRKNNLLSFKDGHPVIDDSYIVEYNTHMEQQAISSVPLVENWWDAKDIKERYTKE